MQKHVRVEVKADSKANAEFGRAKHQQCRGRRRDQRKQTGDQKDLRRWQADRQQIPTATSLSSELASADQLIRHFQSGKIIHRRPAGDYYKSKYGAGHFQVHRADLHNALNAAVLANDPDCVYLAHAFSGLVQSESGVTVHFVNGTVVEGDALIGCDGCRSAVRDTVHGSAPASYTGQVAFRALIPCDNELEHLSAQGAACISGRIAYFFIIRSARIRS
jgi:2-polyprenyl-6-methoxyphenol hydroxylase-like FAD-dependent oxidoreductase